MGGYFVRDNVWRGLKIVTKLSFRVYVKKENRYLKGYKEAEAHFLGLANDLNDDTIISIAFDDGEPDTYYQIEFPPKNIGEIKCRKKRRKWRRWWF